jgi:hypothetical protein
MLTPKEKANELISEMFKFIPLINENSNQSLISAKYCAKVLVDQLIKILPNINETPPIKRVSEDKYFQYWMSVEIELSKIKFF